LIERGVLSLWVYSGEAFRSYNYRRQFRHMFPGLDFKEAVEYDYFKTSDHLFSDAVSRERLLRRVCEWMVRRFPAAAGGARHPSGA
jgi:hypothetical protein